MLALALGSLIALLCRFLGSKVNALGVSALLGFCAADLLAGVDAMLPSVGEALWMVDDLRLKVVL